MTSPGRKSGSTNMDLDLHPALAAILGCSMILSSNLTTDGCEVRRLRSWIFSLFTAPAAPLRRLHSLSSASARRRPHTMIEVPSASTPCSCCSSWSRASSGQGGSLPAIRLSDFSPQQLWVRAHRWSRKSKTRSASLGIFASIAPPFPVEASQITA